MKAKKLLFSAPANALVSDGFLKAMIYSFGSWLTVWVGAWLVTPEATSYLAKYGWLGPLLNTLVVFFKQYFDEVKKSKTKKSK
ncbi:MAG: hypothetical protein ACTSR2_01040 [Candidatus Hodarchaeales archaeon]